MWLYYRAEIKMHHQSEIADLMVSIQRKIYSSKRSHHILIGWEKSNISLINSDPHSYNLIHT